MFKRNSLLKLVLFTFLFFSCKEEIVQPTFYGNITGTVMNEEDSSPIINASITTSPETSSIVSDGSGKFSFNNVEVGEYSITVEKDGYSKKIINVSVESNKSTNAVVLLSEKSTSVNELPSKPNISFPKDGASNQNINLTLSWNATDEDDDSLSFDVYLFSSENAQKTQIGKNLSDTTLFVTDLKYGTTYFWQIIVSDGINESVNGEVWSFTTKEIPNYPTIFTSNISGNFELYSASLDTSNQAIKLTNTPSNELWPRFNPVRDLIAFTNDKDIESHIYTMNTDGTDIYKVTQVPVEGFHNKGIGFCWLPDGNSLYYSNYDKLYRINRDGSGLVQIATAPIGRNFREINVSSDGSKIVLLTIGQYFYDSEIYTMNSDGSEMTLLVDNLEGAIESPMFSIDTKNVLFTRDASGHTSSTKRQLDARVYSINTISKEIIELSKNKTSGTNDLNPRFSPSGGNIIFENAINDNSAEGQIMIMDIDGNNRRTLDVSGRMPDWR